MATLLEILTGKPKVTSPHDRLMEVLGNMYIEPIKHQLTKRTFLFDIERINSTPQWEPELLCTSPLYYGLHNWGPIERENAQVCWACEGKMWYVDPDEGLVEPCNICTLGWLPTVVKRQCQRCGTWDRREL